MSIEFFMVLIAVVLGMAALAWIYCAIFDFVDYWKNRLRREAAAKVFSSKPPTVEARLPPMAPAGRYGMDHEKPIGPPDGWERRSSRPRAARMMD